MNLKDNSLFPEIGPLRILFQSRHDIFSFRGGDSIQFEKTAQALRQQGNTVDIDFSPETDVTAYDVVHIFGFLFAKETWRLLKNAEGKPICLSPIYWNIDQNVAEILEGRDADNPSDLQDVDNFLNGPSPDNTRQRDIELLFQPALRQKVFSRILSAADILLPNSRAEEDLLNQDFPDIKGRSSDIVSNGIDPDIFPREKIGDRRWAKDRGLEDFVLCVGRVEHRKNQLRMLKALADFPYPIVLVGWPEPTYFTQVKKLLRPQDRWLPECPHEELADIYAAARVHVLPSLYETPGLASLEAGAMGCHLVMSSIGSQREYFGQEVVYCDPFNEHTIRPSVEDAWQRPWPNHRLSDLVRERFTWQHAAKQTVAAYRKILGKENLQENLMTGETSLCASE